MFEVRDPTTGELLGRPHGRNAVPAFDVVLRPTKSVSILYGVGDAATARRSWRPTMSAWPRRSPTWTDHLGTRRGHVVSSMCPDRGCWRSGSTIGRPGRVIRCCTPTWWKYRPEFPERFGCYQDALVFCRRFFGWYNKEHRHSGIGFHTPADVHYGRARTGPGRAGQGAGGRLRRSPERFVTKPPAPPKLPTLAWINQPKEEPLDTTNP